MTPLNRCPQQINGEVEISVIQISVGWGMVVGA